MKDWKEKMRNGELVGAELRVGVFRITVHRHISYPDDVWLMSGNHLFTQEVLESSKISEAKCQAEAKLRSMAEGVLSNLGE